MIIRTKGIAISGGQLVVTDASSFIVTNSGSKLSSTRSTSWVNLVQHRFIVDFSSDSNMDSFFNNGGQIRFTGSRIGGTDNLQNASWTNILQNMKMITFDANGTSNTGSLGIGTGATWQTLTGSYQTIFSASGSGAYSSDEYSIEALRGAAGTVTFRINHNDDIDNIVDESVNGTLTTYIDERRFVNDIAPTYTTLTELTAGS